MWKSAMIAIVACSTFAGSVYAGPVGHGQDLDALLKKWETASAQMASMSAAEMQACGEKMAACAAKCPVGSRMGDTLAAVNAALSFSVASCAANEKHCPLTDADANTYADAFAMKEARNATMSKLHKLSSYAARLVTDDAARKSACSATIANGSAEGCCPIQLASKIGALKAGLAQARHELKSLSSADQTEIMNGFDKLSETNKAVALMPETVFALQSGLQQLQQIDAKMHAWAKDHPEFMAKIPEAAMQSYMIEGALLTETRMLLESVTAAMSSMQENVRTAHAGR